MDTNLFGAVYIIEQDYTDDEMRRDLRNMKDCGFHLITLWPVANAWLAHSSHEWVFEKTRFVLDLCQEMEMKAILQLFGQNQAQEFMPDAALTKEMETCDEEGGSINRNNFWANLNHPVVREYFDKYFKEAITALKDHPAVYGWDVFNEAHHRADDPWTVEMYQNWLKKKYKTIEELNYRWYRRYESFSQIRPDRRRTGYSTWSSLLPSVEYEKFRSENLTEFCLFLYDTAKKYDAVHPIIIDGTSSNITYDDMISRNNDEFETAYLPDVYGSTFYPKSWGRNYKTTPWMLSLYFTIPAAAARKAGKPYFVNELQTHTQTVFSPGSEVSCEELNSWILMCVFTGISGLQLWRWRPFLHGYQATGRGLTRMDGTPNKRAAAVRDLLQVLDSHKSFLKEAAVPKPDVKFAYSYGGRLYFDSLLKFGASGKSFWTQNLEGWYKLFWDMGLTADMADLEHLDESDMETPVIVLPGAVSISEKQAAFLCRYVENGGCLIADGRLGTLDEWGCVPREGIPGTTLSRLFGVVEADITSGTAMKLGDETIPAGFESQELELTDDSAQVLAFMEDGSPAVVMHPYGKGRTLYFNSFEGLVLLEKRRPKLEALIAQFLPQAGFIHAKKDQQVHLSCLRTEEETAVLAVNFSDEEQTVELYGLPAGTRMTEWFGGGVVEAGEAAVFTIAANSYAVYQI